MPTYCIRESAATAQPTATITAAEPLAAFSNAHPTIPAPALTQPSAIPALTKPSTFPAPTQPSAFPAPTQPSTVATPTQPSAFPTPTQPSAVPTPTSPSAFPAPSQPSAFPAPSQPSAFPAPSQPSAFSASTLPPFSPSLSSLSPLPPSSAFSPRLLSEKLEELLSLEGSDAIRPGRGTLKTLDLAAEPTNGADTGFTAAWGLDPESTGDYLFRIRVADQVWYRWVSVDLDPPSVSGALLVANSTVTLSNPVTASDDSAVLHLRYMLVQLTFSEPVREFDLAATLKLDGGANFITAECYSSEDAAAKIAAAAAAVVVAAPTMEAAAAPPTDVPPPPPAPPPPPNLLDIGIVQDTTSTASVVSRDDPQYIRSCLAVLYAREGSEPSVSLEEGSVNDVAGNANDT
ncbi:hypothetical protein PLESTM_001478200 [Pleodorina starrii]|nr:hypothetical protein PLESTM_001478200 [Pleodorina starrii]